MMENSLAVVMIIWFIFLTLLRAAITDTETANLLRLGYRM